MTLARGSDRSGDGDAMANDSPSAGERYRALFEHLTAGFAVHRMVFGPDGAARDYVFLEVNPEFERLTGLRREAILGRRASEVLPGLEQDPAAWIERYARVVRSGEPLELVERAGPLGRWFRVSAYRSSPGCFATVFNDVSAEKDFEEERERLLGALREERELLAAAFETTDAQLALLDRELRFERVNEAYLRGCGRSRGELLGREHFALFPDPENERIFRRVLSTGEPYVAEERLFRYPEPQGRGETWWNWLLAPVRGSDGSARGVLLSLHDVTEGVRARQRAERSAAEVEAIFAAMPEGVLLLDPQGRVVRSNPHALALFAELGVPAPSAEVFARLALRRTDGRPLLASEAPERRALGGERVEMDLWMAGADGRERLIDLVASPLVAAGRIAGAVLSVRDVTSRQSLPRLQAATAALSAARTPTEVAEAVFAQALRPLGAVRGSLAYETRPGVLELVASFGFEPGFTDPWRHLPADAPVPTAQAFQSQEPIFLESPAQIAERFPQLAGGDWGEGADHAWCALPLSVHGRRAGVLSCAFSTSHTFDREERTFLDAVAQQCSQALDRARLFEAESRQRDAAERLAARFRLLSRVGALLAGSLDWERAVSDAARVVLGEFAHLVVVDLLTEEGGLRRLALEHVDPERQPHLELLRGEPVPEGAVAWEVVRSRQTFVSAGPLDEEGRAPPDLRDPALLHGLSLHGLITVPVVARGRAVGALGFLRGAGLPRFTEEDVELAEEIGRRAALAFDHAALYAQACTAIQVRDDFLSIAGHELKTPLTTLKLQLEAWARGAPPERARAERVQRNLGRLARLVDELLDVSRVTAGRMVLERSAVDLSQLVRDVVAPIADEAARTRTELQLRLEAPVWGRWDRVRLEQVATNLVTNALKFGAGRPVCIAVDTVGDRARLVVADQGIGIAAADQARIFSRFEQAISARHYGGLGLGLWIARQIVEAHGGTIRVESAPGRGATFTVELPLERPPQPSRAHVP